MYPGSSSRLSNSTIYKHIADASSSNSLASTFQSDVQTIYEYINNSVSSLFGQYSSIVAFGFLDDIFKSIKPEIFYYGFDSNSLSRILKEFSINNEFLDLLSCYDSLVIGDSAYLESSIIRAFCFAHGKPLSVLNPDGTYRKISPVCSLSETHVTPFSLPSNSSDFLTALNAAICYTSQRYQGKANDLDSRLSFQPDLSENIQFPRKKVLFLHSFRDANNINTQPSDIFHSYYEWTDFCLSHIAKSPHDWYIKAHPMSSFIRTMTLSCFTYWTSIILTIQF